MKARDAAWIMLYWILLIALAAWMATSLGCASASKANFSTTQPVDVEQLSGQIVAKIEPTLTAAIETNVQGIGYTSYFGVGPSLIVGAALVLTLWLSHRREMKRLEKRD